MVSKTEAPRVSAVTQTAPPRNNPIELLPQGRFRKSAGWARGSSGRGLCGSRAYNYGEATDMQVCEYAKESSPRTSTEGGA